MFIGLLSTCTVESFDESLAFNSKGHIKCVSLNNRPCQSRPTLANINSNEPLYYQFTIIINKCGRSYNSIDASYAQVYVPDKVFNLMLRVNETRYFVYHESCKSECGLKVHVIKSKIGIMRNNWVNVRN